jgi:prophage antirepressor-like protein
MAANGVDDDERGIGKTETPSGWQDMIIINESALYNPILKSRKPAAKRFTKWVRCDVLSIGNRIATLGLPVQLIFGS